MIMLIDVSRAHFYANVVRAVFTKLPEDEVRRRLKYGIDHLSFALSLCTLQARSGMYFMFEHPASAKSWNLYVRLRRLYGIHTNG